MVCLPLVVLFLASLGSGSINFNVSEFCGLLNQMAATPGYLPSSPGSVFDAYDMVMAALASIPTSLWGTWNISSVDLKFLWAELQLAIILCEKDANARGFDFHPFAPCLDGLVLAPESHTLAFANNITQVIHWHLCAGCQEPYHTHVLASLTFDVRSAGINYFDSHGKIVEATPPHEPGQYMTIESQASEWLHSIQNIDNHTYEVIRVFFVPAINISYSPFQ